uniref:Monodehydroascorbate reductase n=1 Tax=Tanacetum cinerariifolium TaxID=118510 RepID=A0A6L2NIN6_TANCI|nr:hypothetical protein [Tanacetum cinerariifolium]
MDNKKHIVNLESFRDMLHICLRLPGQSFVEPPFEEEILSFLCFLGHNGAIKKLTDVNINKLHQLWRSFATIINKCLTRKSSGYDILQLSQAQILWGLYHKRIVDFTYLMWEEFVYLVEHKDTKKSNEMYYPRFTKVIIHHFMSKDPSIPRRNKVNWHYVRDDHKFTTIKLVSRHQNTQQFGALLPIELTNEDIRNSNAYQEYYTVATGATPHKPKASVRKTRSSFDTTVTLLTAAASLRLSTSAKGKLPAKTSKAKSLSALSEVAMTEAKQLKLATKRSLQQTHISQASGSGKDEGTGNDNEGKDGDHDDEGNDGEEGDDDDDDEQDDDDARDDDDEEDEGDHEEDDQEEGGDDEQASDKEEFIHLSLSTHTEEETRDEESFDPIPKTPEDTDDEGNGEENIDINVGMGEGHDKEEEEDKLYRDVKIKQGRVKVAIQIQSNRLCDEAQKENDEFLKIINENMQKIIKEQVKEQVKTSYAVAPDLSEMELKKILIKKMKGNKSIQRSNEQRNLYKALVEAYESSKIILDTYEDTVTLKRSRDDDADKDEEPSAGSDRGSKRHREGKEPDESAAAEEPMQTTFKMEEPSHPEFETGADDQPIVESSQHPEWFSQQKKPPTPDRDWNKNFPATHGSIQPWIRELAKQSDSRSSFNELMDTPEISHWGRKLQQFYDFAVNRESARDVYSKRRIIAVTELKIVKWHNYKHLDWITVRRDDDKLYKFKEGDFKRLRVWMKLNLTRPDIYRSDLKRKEAYSAYSNPRGFIYQNKDKKNRLMRIDELHKFNDGTLTDVRTALDDRLKGIRMKYLPKSI